MRTAGLSNRSTKTVCGWLTSAHLRPPFHPQLTRRALIHEGARFASVRGESAHVPDKTACPRCNKVGLVRLETVIKGGQSRLHYYCGACAHEWDLTERGAPRKSHRSNERPDRSRA